MAESTPETVNRSVQVYGSLLKLYPRRHREEYGPWMTQVFRDVCLQAYRQDGSWGVFNVWLGTIPDIGESAGQEHYDELRRSIMNWQSQKATIDPRYVMAVLVASVLVALGVLVRAVLVDLGAPVLAGLGILILMNLAGAGIVDLVMRLNGTAVAAMGLFILATLLPLFWVPDAGTWLQENPVGFGFIILLAAFAYQRNHRRWTIYAVALIVSAAQIGVSLI